MLLSRMSANLYESRKHKDLYKWYKSVQKHKRLADKVYFLNTTIQHLHINKVWILHAPGPVATIRNLTLKQSWQKVKRDIAQSMSKWQTWANAQFKVRHILSHIRTLTLPFLHVTSPASLDVCGHEIPAAIHRWLPSILALNLKFFPRWPWHPRVTRWPFVSLWIAPTYLAPVWTPNIILYIYARANLCIYTN